MSETLIIDTGAALKPPPEQRIDPLPLYDDTFPMLQQTMPEYTQHLPNAFMSRLAKQLLMTMKLHGGIGLSANQCGVTARMFVMGAGEFQMICINPRVIRQSDELEKSDEGCLSFPGFHVKIQRPKWIDVEFINEDGKLHQTRLEGLSARCFLHELDHMNGKKLTDHVGPVAIQIARKKQAKLIRNAQRNLKRKDGIFV